MISVIGGSAYSSTGGIQSVNRALTDLLHHAGLLRRAYFRTDSWRTIVGEPAGIAHRPVSMFDGRVEYYSFVGKVLGGALRQPGDAWLVTHINYLPLGVFATFARPDRLAVMLHAAELDDKIGPFRRLLLRRAARIIAVSQFTKRKAEAFGVAGARITVMHHGLDFASGDARALRPPVSDATRPVRFLFVGRMDERYKGQMEILDAAELLKMRGRPLRVDLVGGGRTLEVWRAELCRRGLEQCATFHGWASEERLRSFYLEADVFVMPSQNEGFGLVYAEAMACGLPCIASNVDAAREVVLHGETGFCVPFGNSTALADVMAALIEEPALRQRMGIAARARYEQQFTAAAFERRFMGMLQGWDWIKNTAGKSPKGNS